MSESPRPQKNFDPDWVISPGETLREWIEENGLSTRMTAKACDLLPITIEGILTGTFRISGDVADHLAQGTGVSARLWRNLERAYREGLAAGKKDFDQREKVARALFAQYYGGDDHLTPFGQHDDPERWLAAADAALAALWSEQGDDKSGGAT